MTPETDKLNCKECGKRLLRSDRLEAPHPFEIGICYGCPRCKSIDCFESVCDEPGCWLPVCSGTPCDTHRYRNTCHKHKPNKLNKAE